MSEEAFDEERPLKIGQKVWRAKWDKVEEGVVVRTSLGRITGSGSYDEREGLKEGDKGVYRAWHARFGGWQYTPGVLWIGGDYEDQTYQWKFFDDERQAYRDLARSCRARATEKRREAERWDKLAEEAEARSKS